MKFLERHIINLFSDSGILLPQKQGNLALSEPWDQIWLGIDYIVNQYSHPSRYYHNAYHIDDLLFKYRRFLTDTGKSVNLELKWAILLHDVIYDLPIGSLTNEWKSAAFAMNFLNLIPDLSLDRYLVSDLVRETDYSISFDRDDLSALMHDLDFSGMGESWETFSKNSENIRKEYWWTSDEVFYSSRKKFLESFNKRLFVTDYFYEKFEKQAQENIQRELEDIK